MPKFHVSAGWKTAAGNIGTYAEVVEAEDMSEAMAKVENKLRSDRRRMIRSLDMWCGPYND